MTSHSRWAAVTAMFLISLVCLSSPLPRPQESWYGQRDPQSTTTPYKDDCKDMEDVETLCQTCAKQTRSTIVYPMCCEEREDARAWCAKYMSFGRQLNEDE